MIPDQLETYRMVNEFTFNSLIEINFLIAILLFSCFFIYSLRVLPYKWYNYLPIWNWRKLFSTLDIMAELAESEVKKRRIRFARKGIFYSFGYLVVVAIIGVII